MKTIKKKKKKNIRSLCTKALYSWVEQNSEAVKISVWLVDSLEIRICRAKSEWINLTATMENIHDLFTFVHICCNLSLHPLIMLCIHKRNWLWLNAKCHFDFSTNSFFSSPFWNVFLYDFLYDSSFYVFISSLWIGTHSIGISSTLCNAQWFIQIRHICKGLVPTAITHHIDTLMLFAIFYLNFIQNDHSMWW